MSFFLRALVPAAQQDHQNITALHEIDPVAGTVVDPHFTDARAYRLHITGIAGSEAAHTVDDPRSGIGITKRFDPGDEFVGLAHIDHV